MSCQGGSLQGVAQYVCVEYPGYFKPGSQAPLDTLVGGGPLNQRKHKDLLELRFRPEDPFCHGLFGDRCTTANLLLKISRKRKLEPWQADIVGVVGTTYRFQGMADFQFLPEDTAKRQHTIQEVCESLTDEGGTPSFTFTNILQRTNEIHNSQNLSLCLLPFSPR